MKTQVPIGLLTAHKVLGRQLGIRFEATSIIFWQIILHFAHVLRVSVKLDFKSGGLIWQRKFQGSTVFRQ